MLNRRSIISSIFGMATTPALIAAHPKSSGATSQGTGEQKKYIMIVVDHHRVSRQSAARLGDCLRKDGFKATIISVYNAPEPIKVIDLSNLPEADLAEVRRLCEEARG